MRPLRIVLAKKLLSTIGGSEAQARALAAALRDRGHDVTLLGLRPAYRRPGIPPAVFESAPGDVTVAEGGLTFRFVASPAARLEGLLPVSLIGDDRLAPALRGADIVHCIAREWTGPLERAARRAGAAFVETPLVHPGQALSGDGRADIARYRRDDAVLALTEHEAAWYRERGARAFVTGVGPIIGPLPDVPMDPATILFVGRKERYKGYDALRAAAPMVWRERPEARFVIIGQRRFLGPAPLADQRWSERGMVDEAAKAEAYVRATVFAMPSSHETFGHTYLEAWSAGRPVIAGDIAPLREVVRESVDGLHAACEPRAIAGAILTLLRDPAGAARMGTSGRARLLERWTWPRVAERTEAAYGATLG
ncbi:MAG TPA: glycosyltransferase family 4 protein [Candidatus Limnocylindria bacterium]